ncbi:PREDICTED: proprotein convertase subtilisin/kexin type 9, partial [Tauraco erythrolophus]|uniref:proprotein convertase subtilisin/kexin type 9 n=1 Tax=Tauraco erythrolophus TaxID=121530 RepID=UPI000523CBAA
LTKLLHVFHLLPAFLVKMSSDVLDMALKLPHVEYVEEDAYVFAQSIPWNLGRIVPPQPSSGTYSPPNKGDLVEIYLLDTSVQSTHREIEGRVLVTDFESVPEEDGTRFHRQASKCDSHGTHVAGVLRGRHAGLEFIKATLEARPYAPLVVVLPFTGAYSRVLNAGWRRGGPRGGGRLLGLRIPFHSCAPLSPPWQVITVGATNKEDQPASIGTLGTNFGRCVDLFAPGDDIIGASSDCSTCFMAQSGTSQAAAHVAGELGCGVAGRAGSPLALSGEDTGRVSLEVPGILAACAGDILACHHATILACLGAAACTELLHPVHEARPAPPVARCAGAEEMLSCSSFSRSSRRLGEHMEDKDGQKQCVAHNAFRGRGVYAIARCCTWPRAECRINASSRAAEGAGCSPRDHGGVSTPPLDGGRPVPGPGSGASRCASRTEMMAHALCCPATSLECRVKEHVSPGSAEKVTVSCDDGWTLTGCNAHSQSPGTMGAYAVDNTCVAASDPGSSVAVAIAICCRSRQ